MVQAGLIDKVKQPLEKEGIDFGIFDKCKPDAPINVIKSCAQFAKEGSYDLVITVGGGSALDIGKVATIMATAEDIEQAFSEFTTEKERDEFDRLLELDLGRSIVDVGRVRFNVARQRGTISIVARLLPSTIPTIEDLGLPEICRELVEQYDIKNWYDMRDGICHQIMLENDMSCQEKSSLVPTVIQRLTELSGHSVQE